MLLRYALLCLLTVGCAGFQDSDPLVFESASGRTIQWGDESTHVDVTLSGKIYVSATIETAIDICYGDDAVTTHVVMRFLDMDVFGLALGPLEVPLMVDAACEARGIEARRNVDAP